MKTSSMKTSTYFRLLAICACFGLFACSSDDSTPPDDGGGVTPPPATDLAFTQRILIEDYTGTWCGNCPKVAFAIEQVKLETENVVAVGIHRASSDQNNPNYDPYNYQPAEALEQEYGIAGYPWAMLNRTTKWSFPVPNNIDQAVDLAQGTAALGIALEPTLESGTLNVNLNVKFGTDFTENLKTVVYVMESGLTYDQENYTSYYNGDDVLVDFEYDHVLRAPLTDLFGDAIPSSETTLENTYSTSFSVSVSDLTVQNSSNIYVVAFVVNADGSVLNVREADLNETQSFEEVQG